MREALEKKGSREQLLHPTFLKDLIQLSMRRGEHKATTYSDAMKSFSLYLFILAGPTAYSVIRENLPLPSIATVKRHLGQESYWTEGEIRAEQLKARLVITGEPLFVWCAEDETAITKRIRYKCDDDQIVGIQLPLDQHGLPIKGSFKFTSMQAARSYLRENKLSTYAKLIACRSLSTTSKTFFLTIYGTCPGSDNTQTIIARWDRITEILGEHGVIIVGKKEKFPRIQKIVDNYLNVFHE